MKLLIFFGNAWITDSFSIDNLICGEVADFIKQFRHKPSVNKKPCTKWIPKLLVAKKSKFNIVFVIYFPKNPEILGKWRFRRIGKNVKAIAFPTQLRSMWVSEPPSKVQGWSHGCFSYLKVLTVWKYNSGLLYSRRVIQNNQTAHCVKCPNAELFLVCIFVFDWIQESNDQK